MFRKDGADEFIRELVDYGDKDFTSTDYAYKDGKPWAIVQETKSSRDGKTTRPTAPAGVTMVSWW